MLHKCANSTCSTPFRRLHEGKLFQVETEYLPALGVVASWRRNQPVRKVERYWLCDICAPQMTLSFDQGGVMTVPLSRKPATSLKLPVERPGLELRAQASGN